MGTALGEEQMEVLWRHHPEPTLCFDGDRAGRQAAARTMDRALPLLQPGKSFRFALVEGGKDPDEVLREQGPAALKSQLARTTPFVEALFARERDLEDLDTPERRTALKARLRKAAALIADKDLSQAYKEDLLGRYEQLWPTRAPVYTVGAAARELSRRRWDGKRAAPPARATAEGKEAAERLRGSARPLAAALALAALQDPSVIDDKIELVGARGFGDAKLDGLARELVLLRYEAESLDYDAALRRLKARGLDDALIARLSKDAGRAGVSAPFLDPAAARDQARALWRQAFDLLMQLESLERAVEAAARDLPRDQDSSTLMALKSERDSLRRLVNSDWAHPEEAAQPVLPH
jgi:DNA primase